jgi:dTDP-4-dehydrorhamnose 3,5-epimerase
MLQQQILVNTLTINAEPYISGTEIPELLLIRRPQYSDDRGFFQEEYRLKDLSERLNRQVSIAQSQVSVSFSNVLRGIHAEPWDKFITPLTGRMLSVIVDLRRSSPTFKKWIMFEFDNTSNINARTSIFVPQGCGNSLIAFKASEDTGDGTVFYQYSSSALYDPKNPGLALRWNDPDLSIPWPVDEPILTQKDQHLPLLKDLSL